MQTLRLCVFLAFIAALRAYELSGTLAELYCVINGNYNNRDQVGTDFGSRGLIEKRLQPVLAPALSEIPVVYYEQSNDGVLSRALVHIVTQGEHGKIYLEPYNFTGNSQIKPGAFDTDRIKSLTLEDLQGREICKASIERVEPFVFSIHYPVCERAAVKGPQVSYSATITCNEFIAVIPEGAPETPTLEPNRLKLQGHKYPLENAPVNYVCNCQNTCGWAKRLGTSKWMGEATEKTHVTEGDNCDNTSD